MEMINGLVTIGIPVYKTKYLREAIESAINQTYTNIEIVIVNDHSIYDVDSIVYSYADTRIRYFVNEKNVGIVNNWNRCLSLARGEFFVLLCDDDVLLPDFVFTLVDLAHIYPNCNIFHARRSIINEKSEIIGIDDEWSRYESYNEFIYNKLESNRWHTVTEFLYRTSVIQQIKYVFYPGGWCSDDATVISIVKTGGIVSSDIVLVMFRESTEQVSYKGKYPKLKAIARIQFYNDLLHSVEDSYHERLVGLYEYYLKDMMSHFNAKDRLLLLLRVPNRVWPIRQKIAAVLIPFV